MSTGADNACAIYIAGMDQNIDLIRCAVDCLQRRANVRSPIYIGVEEENPEIDGTTVLLAPKGYQWTTRARAHLDQIPNKYVLMLLEDYFVYGIDEDSIHKLALRMPSYGAGVVKLVPVPRPDHGIPGEQNLGFYKHFEVGRTNTQPALWDKNYLQSLLRGDESLWQFEINGSIRSNTRDGNIMGVYRNLLEYDEVVKRGKFRNRFKRRYQDIIESAGIPQRRGFLDLSTEIKLESQHFGSQVLRHFLPQHHRTVLRRKLRF